MVVFPFASASVNYGARFCNGALEAHHHPLAGRAWSTCMGTIWYCGASWVEFHSHVFFFL